MEMTFRPISIWPGPMTKSRRSSQFRAPYSDTLQLLDTELRHLGAKRVALQVALRDEDIRLDGAPRKDARPMHPGVILSFDSKYGPLNYPCDRFPTWEENLRAIALALEALRKVDRYGVTSRAEQYRGWQALPGPAPKITIEEAIELLQPFAGGKLTKENLVEAYRKAVLKFHPDRGGDSAKFQRIGEAKELLEKAL